MTVSLKFGPAETGAQFTITDNNPGIVSYSSPAVLAAGEYAKDVTLTGLVEGSVTVKAVLTQLNGAPVTDGDEYTLAVQVLPVSALELSGISPDEVEVQEGRTHSVIVSFSVEVSGDQTVMLHSSDTAVATVPASVVVPDGDISASFDITAVADGASTVTASHAAGTGQTDVTVTKRDPVLITGVPSSPIASVEEI